jgi:hypothetical protein
MITSLWEKEKENQKKEKKRKKEKERRKKESNRKNRRPIRGRTKQRTMRGLNSFF